VTHCTLAELRQRMTHAELMTWAAAYDLRPWGEIHEDREDIRHAVRTYWMARGAGRTLNPDNLLPRWGAKPVSMTSAEVKAGFAAYAGAMNRGRKQ